MPDSFRRQLEAAGQVEGLEAIPQRPILKAGLDFYYDAYFRLSTTRQTGFGVSVISWLHVEQYAALTELDTMSKYFLHRVVERLDPIFVEHVSNESKRNQNRKNA